MKSRLRMWGMVTAVSLILLLLGRCVQGGEAIPTETIYLNVPQAMHQAFKVTLEDLKLDETYELKFTNKEANFTVTTQKDDSNELIAFSPLVSVFNSDEEMYESYIQEGIFIPSDTEPEQYDFDFQKIMKDIIENEKSIYKVYYPDSSICNPSVFYTFLLYTANDECYPTDGENMAETTELVEAFLQSKNSEPIGLEALDKIKGFSKNSIYFLPLADLGYVYESEKILCRVMYPKTVVYCNYYASFDEVGKVLFDALEEKSGGFWSGEKECTGYYNLRYYGNYFVKPYEATVSIVFYSGNGRYQHNLRLRENFNAVELPETFYNKKEEQHGI